LILPAPAPTLTLTLTLARRLGAALSLAALVALGVIPSEASPGPMQVEEPAAQAAQPPIQPDQEMEGWMTSRNATLSASQQAALKARQDTMKDMMALIQQKRRAIREARPEDRQALAQELHQIILDQAQGADRNRIRAESRKDPMTRNPDAALEKRERALEQQEDYLREQESLRRQAEEKLKRAEPKAAPEEKTGD